MAISRRKFTLEFRTEAAHRVIDTGRSVRAVADELSVEENTLSKWVRDERRRQETLNASSDIPLTVAERLELQRLRREVSELQKDHDFLKKQPRTSRQILQSREICVNARGVRELRSQAHGPALGGIHVRLLPLGAAPRRDGTGHPAPLRPGRQDPEFP